jgi:hypothetical protein
MLSDEDYNFQMTLAEMTFHYSSFDHVDFRSSTYKIINETENYQNVENELWILLNFFFSLNVNSFDKQLIQYENSPAYLSILRVCNNCKAVANSFTVILKCIYKKYILSNIKYDSDSVIIPESEVKREVVSFLGFAIKTLKDSAYKKRDEKSVIKYIYIYIVF